MAENAYGGAPSVCEAATLKFNFSRSTMGRKKANEYEMVVLRLDSEGSPQ